MSDHNGGDAGAEHEGTDGEAAPSDEALAALHDHLAATAERPVEREASRWLGEAEAVAADAVAADHPDAVGRRLAQVRDLLSNVEGTGDRSADEHVRRARALAADLAPDEGGANSG